MKYDDDDDGCFFYGLVHEKQCFGIHTKHKFEASEVVWLGEPALMMPTTYCIMTNNVCHCCWQRIGSSSDHVIKHLQRHGIKVNGKQKMKLTSWVDSAFPQESCNATIINQGRATCKTCSEHLNGGLQYTFEEPLATVRRFQTARSDIKDLFAEYESELLFAKRALIRGLRPNASFDWKFFNCPFPSNVDLSCRIEGTQRYCYGCGMWSECDGIEELKLDLIHMLWNCEDKATIKRISPSMTDGDIYATSDRLVSLGIRVNLEIPSIPFQPSFKTVEDSPEARLIDFLNLLEDIDCELHPASELSQVLDDVILNLEESDDKLAESSAVFKCLPPEFTGTAYVPIIASMNHDDEPNVELFIDMIPCSDKRMNKTVAKVVITLEAIRTIYPNEELTIRYSSDPAEILRRYQIREKS
eukprot:GHVH01002142.1.p1 GENE.GHVH01002142.1~~GHVH01002142.1.p1  ORF type:complete len:414 (-),score=56.59 GHVH01002142.1:1005-2246(-)